MKTVTIVGAGALGSHVMLFARNWEARFRVIDFDRVEQKNVLAQFHSKMGMRQNKALALQKAMGGLFGLNIKPFLHKLTGDNAEALLGGSDLVIDCTDNAEARRVIQDFVLKCKLCGLTKGLHDHDLCKGSWEPTTEVLHGCLSAAGDFARIIWTENFTPDEEGEPGQATCEDGEQLPFFAMAASVVAQTAQQFLADGTKRNYQLMPGKVISL